MRNYHSYTDEERAYLMGRIPETTHAQAAKEFEERFGIPRTSGQIADFARHNGIRSGYNGPSCGRVAWTPEMDDWLRLTVPGRSEAEAIAAFEERFGIVLRVPQLKGRLHALGVRHGVNTGRIGGCACKLVPGWNKGMPQSEIMSEESIERTKATRFKKGGVPHNRKPIGSEFADDAGYVYIKVKHDLGAKRFGPGSNWKQRSRIVYEKHHGKVPDRCRIVHADRDPANDDPDNLVAVDVSDYAVLAKHQMQYYDRESLEACLANVRLIRGIWGARKEQ